MLGGQQVRLPPTVQHARPFGQQRLLPQHRCVALLQHFVPHSSWFALQRLHRPVLGFAQRQFLGQHLPGPQRARPCGHVGWQAPKEIGPERPWRHSSLGLQQALFAQQKSSPWQQLPPHGVPTHGQFRSTPSLPQRVPGGQAAAWVFWPWLFG